jgi:fructosamine-3-kinase
LLDEQFLKLNTFDFKAMTNYIKLICEAQGMQYLDSRRIGGGDINHAYTVDTNSGRFFMKLNSASQFPSMFVKEAEGLKALQQASSLKVPEVVAMGELEGQQYLLFKWLEKTGTSKTFWEQLAVGLAQIHRITDSHFGWTSYNYIGSLVQTNEHKTSWKEFYSSQRILPLAEKLYNYTALSKADVMAAEKICDRLEEIFPDENPSLVHGDLWAGNFMAVQSTGKRSSMEVMPSVFDPAVYFGNREMDLGMSLLFGRFDPYFYHVYNEIFPLEKHWQERLTLTQLYPLLVHALLFSGR